MILNILLGWGGVVGGHEPRSLSPHPPKKNKKMKNTPLIWPFVSHLPDTKQVSVTTHNSSDMHWPDIGQHGRCERMF